MLLKPIFLVEMLTYLSSPMYSMYLILLYFIEGRAGYLPFKKIQFLSPQNRGKSVHKNGAGDTQHHTEVGSVALE